MRAGISVFTHLPGEMQFAWLEDLRRMLKPGGLLLTTKLSPLNHALPVEIEAAGVRDGFVFWGESAATAGLPDFYRLAYHADEYARLAWGDRLEVLSIGSRDINGTQDRLLLQRPAAVSGISGTRYILPRLAAKLRAGIGEWRSRRRNSPR